MSYAADSKKFIGHIFISMVFSATIIWLIFCVVLWGILLGKQQDIESTQENKK